MHIKSAEYYEQTISKIERAITATTRDLREATDRYDNRGVEAQASYLYSIERVLARTKEEYAIWKALPSCCDECDTRRGICHSNTVRGSKTCFKNRRMRRENIIEEREKLNTTAPAQH